MIFEFDFAVPSVNNLRKFNTRSKTWYLTKEGEKYKREIEYQTHSTVLYYKYFKTLDKWCKNNKLILKACIFCYEDWFCKNGKVKRKDIDNKIKFFIDCVYRQIGVDDKHNFDIHIIKVQSKEEKTILKIEEVDHETAIN